MFLSDDCQLRWGRKDMREDSNKRTVSIPVGISSMESGKCYIQPV